MGTAFQTYVESGGAIQSGIAVANPSSSSIVVTLEISGFAASLPVPANGQRSMFLSEIPAFRNLRIPFQGVLRITSATPIAVTGLRGRTNERGDFLITSTTPVDESAGSGAGELFFPHFAEGGGYSMQFILFGPATSGTMYFFDQTGNPAPVLFR
jgi:hypothetical protein